MAENVHPFGNPDGTRGDIDELDRIFVSFNDFQTSGGLATRADDMAARFLIGRRGSGKTIHLRRLRAHAATLPEIYAATVDQNPPNSSLIVRFAFRAKGHERTELWRLAWQRAILRATLSHLLGEPKLRDRINPTTRQLLAENYGKIVGPAEFLSHKIGVFAHMVALLGQDLTSHEIGKYLHNPLWAAFEEDLHSALKDCRRLCFYLDAGDEHFGAAPGLWQECHVGLFLAVMDLLRDPRFGGMLHVFVALRDAVLLKVLQSEHGLRYQQDEHIRVLDWDYNAIRHFLHQKILRLDHSLLAKPDAQDPIERWLGSRTQFVSTRNCDEAMGQYLLRHTRFLPRDVIVQGNQLCSEVASAKSSAQDAFKAGDSIRRAVRNAATGFGNDLLNRCAGHILADNISVDAIRYGYESNYLDENAGLFAEIRKELDLLLRDYAGYERMSRDIIDLIELAALEKFAKMFEKFGEKFGKRFDSSVDILSALWLNGLIGYVEPEASSCVVFYSHRHATQLSIPRYKEMYAYHCSLIDTIGIRPNGNPMVPCS